MFCRGLYTPNNIGRVVSDGNHINSQLAANSPENSLSGSNSLNNNEISQLRDKIYKMLYKKNKSLCDKLFRHSFEEADMQIRSVAWEEQLQPLMYSEVERISSKLVLQKKVEAINKGNLNYNVLHLADRNWITVDGIVRSQPSSVFPLIKPQQFCQLRT